MDMLVCFVTLHRLDRKGVSRSRKAEAKLTL